MQARRNLAVMRYLVDHAEVIGPGAAEWAITVAFYAALHALEAFLIRAGLTSSGHTDRARKLAQAGVPYDVVDSYKLLQQWSEQARYLLAEFDVEFVRSQLVAELRVVLVYVGLDDEPSAPPAVEDER